MERKKLITPRYISDEEYARQWQQTEYAGKAMKKIEDMECHGIFPGKNLLITSETGTNPLNMIIVDMIIREYLI